MRRFRRSKQRRTARHPGECRYGFDMSTAVQYLTNEKGRKQAVVLPIEEYERLLEDLDDLAVIAERRDEGTIPHAELKRSVKRHASSR